MKTLGIILLIMGLVSIGFSGLCIVTKERFADFDPLSTATNRTSLYDSTLAAILLGAGTVILITEKNDRFISKHK